MGTLISENEVSIRSLLAEIDRLESDKFLKSIEIGRRLVAVKNELEHGEFIAACERLFDGRPGFSRANLNRLCRAADLCNANQDLLLIGSVDGVLRASRPAQMSQLETFESKNTGKTACQHAEAGEQPNEIVNEGTEVAASDALSIAQQACDLIRQLKELDPENMDELMGKIVDAVGSRSPEQNDIDISFQTSHMLIDSTEAAIERSIAILANDRYELFGDDEDELRQDDKYIVECFLQSLEKHFNFGPLTYAHDLLKTHPDRDAVACVARNISQMKDVSEILNDIECAYMSFEEACWFSESLIARGGNSGRRERSAVMANFLVMIPRVLKKSESSLLIC